MCTKEFCERISLEGIWVSSTKRKAGYCFRSLFDFAQKTRSICSHLDQTNLVNKGITILKINY